MGRSGYEMEEKQRRRWAYGVVAVLVASIALCILADWEVFYGIGAACVAAAIGARRLGHSWKQVGAMALSRLKNVKGIAIMLFLIGGTIGLWMASGVSGTFVYYGLKYLSGFNLVLVAFLLCGVVCPVIGAVNLACELMGFDLPWVMFQIGGWTAAPWLGFVLACLTGVLLAALGLLCWKATVAFVKSVSGAKKKLEA